MAVVEISDPTEPFIAWLGFLKLVYYYHTAISIVGDSAGISASPFQTCPPHASQGWVHEGKSFFGITASIAIVADYAYTGFLESVTTLDVTEPSRTFFRSEAFSIRLDIIEVEAGFAQLQL